MSYTKHKHQFKLSLGVMATACAIAALTVSVARADSVNYDDPNMARTDEYVGDSAAKCLKGNHSKACMKAQGVASEVTELPEALHDIAARPQNAREASE